MIPIVAHTYGFDMQGQRNSRKLTKGESNLWIGDGARVAAVAIGTYVLNLPCVFCLNLEIAIMS